MKQKLALILSFLVLAVGAFAQKDKSSKRSFVAIHLNSLDVKSPKNWKDDTGPRTLGGLKDNSLGFGVSYWRLVCSKVDFSVKGNLMFHDYAAEDRGVYLSGYNQIGVELEPTINIKALKEESTFNMFLTGGVGGGIYSNKFGAYIPAGVGLQANFSSLTYVLLQSQYRFSLTKDIIRDNLFYSLGVGTKIGREIPKVVPPPPPPPVVDRDNDGVLDVDDKCPDVAGLASLQGCPDRDGDGIADGDDKCPDVAGTAKYQGCPIPDTDGDGVNDEEDKCPTEKGFARYKGCPIPDTDKDGVNDEEDKCPSRPGPASNMGCPVIAKEVIEKINVAAKNIFFATGSTKLLPKSFKSLDEVVTLLKADESLMIAIDGHTDSTGTREKNMTLSDGRAASVKSYLASKGVPESRMTSTGYGPDRPVAPNKTAKGRALNRRVEMAVRNY
jgi:outer membrane protein OmpA-like peptidoglycan-associated protein